MSIEQLTHTVKSNVKHLDDLAGGLEAVALAITTRAAAWLSTIPTVMLTSRTVSSVFGLSPAAGIVSSIALEIVGQSTADLWLSAKEWNDSKRKSDPEANERLALAMMATYFIADFALVSVLELPKAFAGEWGHLSSLLFPVMQVVSTLALTERSKQFKRVATIEAERTARTAQRAGKRTGNVQEVDDVLLAERPQSSSFVQLDAANSTRRTESQDATARLLDAYRDDPHMSFAAAGRAAGRSKSWAAQKVKELEEAGAVRKNGRGVEIL